MSEARPFVPGELVVVRLDSGTTVLGLLLAVEEVATLASTDDVIEACVPRLLIGWGVRGQLVTAWRCDCHFGPMKRQPRGLTEDLRKMMPKTSDNAFDNA